MGTTEKQYRIPIKRGRERYRERQRQRKRQRKRQRQIETETHRDRHRQKETIGDIIMAPHQESERQTTQANPKP